jgi:hypothetical protein
MNLSIGAEPLEDLRIRWMRENRFDVMALEQLPDPREEFEGYARAPRPPKRLAHPRPFRRSPLAVTSRAKQQHRATLMLKHERLRDCALPFEFCVLERSANCDSPRRPREWPSCHSR